MKNNLASNKFKWFYSAGFFVILALPIFVIPPYLFPADWGKTIAFRIIMAVLLFLFAFQFFFKKNQLNQVNFKKNKVALVLVALFLIYLAASIFSTDPLFSFWGSPYRGGGFVDFAFYIIFAILTFILFKKNDWGKAWLAAIFIGILVSFIGIIQRYGLFNKIFLAVPDRPPSTMGNPDILALYLLLLIFTALAFFVKTKNKYLKIFYGFAVLIFFYTILITGSRAIYLGITLGILYFGLFYPKKIKVIKTTIIGLLILTVCFGFYVNIANQYPKFLQNNKLFSSITPRLLLRPILNNARFYAWTGIDYKILIDKLVLGYGPENFAVGFDKYYNPAVPNIQSEGVWWDRAHNIIIQTVSDAGIFALISYLALFGVLFWQLHKVKLANKNDANKSIITHAIQATLIGYLAANFFSFDSFSTYIIFFLLVGYSMHLIYGDATTNSIDTIQKKATWKSISIFVLFGILVIFLWQYNFVPLEINAKINVANNLTGNKKCDQAFYVMDKIMKNHSFLDSYARMEYVEFTKACTNFYPENNLTYIKKDVELIKEAVKIQPFYTRYWIFLGEASTTLALKENNPKAKSNFLQQAKFYFDRALQLAPKHQEILTGLAKMEIAASDYQKAQGYSNKCIALNSNFGGCYWYLGLSKIYLKDISDAKKNIQIAADNGYDTNFQGSLSELSDAYGFISDYQDLVLVYEKLISINPNVAQYHSSLAFFYAKLGEYDKARNEAAVVLKLSPQSKPNVDAFLKTLP